jgi:PST family polysaccharide transporter
LPYLVVSRGVDQGALAVASLLLARLVGPEAFAPVAVLLVVNSLAVQVSDFGLGFAVLRARPGEPLAVGSLHRLRVLSVVVVLVGSLAGLVLGGVVGATVGAGAWVWAFSSEAYVRKSACLRAGRARQVASAEVAGAVVILAAAIAVWATDVGVVWFGLGLVLKHVVEVALARDWRGSFAPDGGAARSGAEWLGQIASYAVANVDYLVVGLVLTPAELSTYVIAFRMASALPALLANPITNMAFVELADATGAERDLARTRVLRRARRAGLLGGLAVLLAAPLLPVVLGPSWEGTGWLVAVLAPAVPFRLLLGTAVAGAITAGAARRVVGWESARLVAVGAAALVGATFGLVPATAMVSVTTIVSLTVVHRRSAGLGGEVGPRREWFAALGASAAVALLALAAGAAIG